MPPSTWPATLGRKLFEDACRALLEERVGDAEHDDPLRLSEIWAGWTWKEHPRYPGFGYLHRTVTLMSGRPGIEANIDLAQFDDELSDIPDIPDGSAAMHEPAASTSQVRVDEHIVYSATFQVPVFYFTASDESGAPLNLDRLVRSSLFHLPLPLSDLEIEAHAISLPSPNTSDDIAPVPLLTQGEHPSTGEMCWYLHPCETSLAVKELLDHREQPPGGDVGLEWLKAWFVVLGRVVYLRSGGIDG